MYEILYYQTSTGTLPFEEWTQSLHDQAVEARIAARLDRICQGNFGDAKALGGGLYELRIHFGPGYRGYYATVGKQVVLLLCGGDKGSSPRILAPHVAI
jgi:putative addiction module killer protein